MSHFDGLDPQVIGIVLVGAEGCSETAHEPWLRDANDDEKNLFRSHCHQLFQAANGASSNKTFEFGKFLVDGNGRPYWLKAVLDHPATPSIAKEKAQQFTRVLRIGSD